MSTLANWYSNQYGYWRRSRRQDHDTAPGDTTTTATRLPLVANATPGNATEKTANGAPETLFGPSLGAVTQAPEWTNRLANAARGKNVQDELTPDIVRAWVQKSKDKTQPTTTLQALVNLKRPTLRLSPLTDAEEGAAHQHVHAHAVEFEFDADAPKCGITIHVLPAGDNAAPVQVYEHVLDGGFGKRLGLDDDAALELSKFEAANTEKADQANGSTPALPTSTSEAMLSSPAQGTPAAATRRRFSNFHFRRPRQVAQSAGPALQVVDVDAQNQHGTADGDTAAETRTDESNTEAGVRVIIKLEALDENERSLASVNTQTTYLHVVRFGSKPDGAAEGDEDIRPWVVKVVKREATIGFHTFHLHEIYGLTSGNTNAPATTNEPATYPPATAPAPQASYEFAGQECVLCLSSPREVVLLPCRHLVACRDCALNMIEFGAGGQLNQTTEATTPAPAAAPAAPTGAADVAGDVAAADAAAAAGTPTPAPRQRKRKPKGWFCPVCRQPYTSLLRISTTPPDAKQVRDSEDGEEVTTTIPLAAAGVTAPAHVVGDATPSPVPTPAVAQQPEESAKLPDDAVVIPVSQVAEDPARPEAVAPKRPATPSQVV